MMTLSHSGMFQPFTFKHVLFIQPLFSFRRHMYNLDTHTGREYLKENLRSCMGERLGLW